MRSAGFLSGFENRWETALGAWFPGERVVIRDLDLFEDFKDKSWMALLMYAVRGRMPNDNEAKLGEAIWKFATSFPDPRLWNNRIAALAGTARSTGNLGLAGALAVSEASIFGRGPDIRAIDFLIRLKKFVDGGGSMETFIAEHFQKHRSLPGFGRPIVSDDERVQPLLAEAARLGLDRGRHVQLVKEAQEFLQQKRYRIKANIAAYCAALMADLGYAPREYYYMALLSFVAGILPCYIDAKERREGTFFPFRCEVINYLGNERRTWP